MLQSATKCIHCSSYPYIYAYTYTDTCYSYIYVYIQIYTCMNIHTCTCCKVQPSASIVIVTSFVANSQCIHAWEFSVLRCAAMRGNVLQCAAVVWLLRMALYRRTCIDPSKCMHSGLQSATMCMHWSSLKYMLYRTWSFFRSVIRKETHTCVKRGVWCDNVYALINSQVHAQFSKYTLLHLECFQECNQKRDPHMCEKRRIKETNICMERGVWRIHVCMNRVW